METNLWSLQYLGQQEDQPALALLPAVADPPVDHMSARLWQIRDLIEAGQLLRAETLLTPLVRSGDQDVLRLQAELLTARGDLTAALSLLATFGAVDELLDMGQLAQASGRLDVAALAYRTAYNIDAERALLPLTRLLWREQNNLPDAEELLRHYIVAAPNSRYFTRWQLELGLLYRAQSEWEKAQSIFAQLVATEPDNAAAWIQLGWTYYDRGDGVETAITQFQQAIAATPQEGEGYFAVATLLVKERRYNEADLWFVQALEKEPSRQWWWEARATAMKKLSNLKLSTQIYEAIIERFPNSISAHIEAALLYRRLEERTKALESIEIALSLINPADENQRIVNASYYVHAGEIYEWSGAVHKAVAAYRQAQQLDPSRPGNTN
ncbi:MAG: tetratricopeptide repeat protein [Caldilineaceae bacterium]